jgi:hypothetical protein
MRQLQMTPDNKSYIVRRYCDYVLSRIDNDEVYTGFKDYFFREKMGYPIDTLKEEIGRYCPEILEDHLAESVVGKDKEYDFYSNPVDITD